MKTNIAAEILATDAGARANDILRSCVHCGFCNATCPTYQLTGDELDGPRGRIYLIRELLEGSEDTQRVTQHLDRCLTCRACETTCPSGVAYGELAEIAREQIGWQRPGMAGIMRKGLKWLIPKAPRLRFMTRLGQLFKWFVPKSLVGHLPMRIGHAVKSGGNQDRKVVLLNGCAQQVVTAATNEHFATLLARHQIGVVTLEQEACCGALDLHLGDRDSGMAYIKRNVDQLYPLLDEVEAVISTASGCGVTVKDYGRLLKNDPEYAEKSKRVSERTKDVSEYLQSSALPLSAASEHQRVAWHTPCTLQHGQQITGVVEGLLTAAGYELTPVADAHLCCGSAGTYSVLQPEMSETLRQNKLDALLKGRPHVIASANVGCQSHLDGEADVDVVHWIELLK